MPYCRLFALRPLYHVALIVLHPSYCIHVVFHNVAHTQLGAGGEPEKRASFIFRNSNGLMHTLHHTTPSYYPTTLLPYTHSPHLPRPFTQSPSPLHPNLSHSADCTSTPPDKLLLMQVHV